MAMHYSSKTNNGNKDIKMNIIEECGACTARNNGDQIKIRFISWNDKDPKYDIRIWSKNDDGTERCGKGFTLDGEELEEIHSLIDKLINEE